MSIQNHIFFSKSKILFQLNLANFNLLEFSERWDNTKQLRENEPSFSPIKADLQSSQRTILDIVGVQSGSYGVANSLALAELYKIIDYYESGKNGSNPEKNSLFDKKIKDIKSSFTGKVKFSFPTDLISSGSTGETDVYFMFIQGSQNMQSRTVLQSQPPTFVSTPRTTTGLFYSYADTNEIAQDIDSAGTYVLNQLNKDNNRNFRDQVAAELDVAYDHVTGKWVAQHQTLARLITDIPAAELLDTSQLTKADMENASNKDWYAENGKYNLSGFKVGEALPISVEKGDPKLCGPDIKECGEKKLHTIKVVNRAPRSFKKGDVVMLTKINGEWIVQDFGKAEEIPLPAKSSDWKFIKYISNSDHFFKDFRHYQPKIGNDTEEERKKYARPVSIDTYINASRFLFYDNVNQKLFAGTYDFLKPILSDNSIKTLFDYNTSNQKPDFIPSKGYFISTVFDQMNTKFGGFSEALSVDLNVHQKRDDVDFFKKINFLSPTEELGPQGDKYAKEFSNFFGPVFSEGYSTFLPIGSGGVAILNDSNIKKYGSGDYIESLNQYLSSGTVLTEKLLEYANNRGIDFPAEISSKIIDFSPIVRFWSVLGTKPIKNYYHKPIFYGSKLNNPSSVQFICLHDVFACHQDLDGNYFGTGQTKGPDRNGYVYFNEVAVDFTKDFCKAGLISPITRKDLVEDRNEELILDRQSFVHTMWGNMFDRACFTGYRKLNSMSNFHEPLKSKDDCLSYVRFDSAIRNVPIEEIYGATYNVFNFEDETKYKGRGANLVGVTAAINTIQKRNNNEIIFNVLQTFGQKTFNQRQLSSILGTNVTIPQWGSSSDTFSSFGTTGLWVQIYDHWPEEDTIYDPRYFAILHFNPGDIYSNVSGIQKGKTKEELTDASLFNSDLEQYKYWKIKDYLEQNYISELGGPLTLSPEKIDYQRDIDLEQSPVDFRIPTYANPKGEESYPSDNTIVPLDTMVNSRNILLRPPSEWRINPIRRGQLLSGVNGLFKFDLERTKFKTRKRYNLPDDFVIDKGFVYFYTTIGLNRDSEPYIHAGGKGFEMNQTIDLEKEVQIKITKIDGNGAIQEIQILDRGEGFLPNNFATRTLRKDPSDDKKFCYKQIIPANSGGEPAIIEFYEGIVYNVTRIDLPPTKHGGNIRLTTPSAAGRNGVIRGDRQTKVPVAKNLTNLYDCFYFFQNDISHAATYDNPDNATARTDPWLQFVKLDIS